MTGVQTCALPICSLADNMNAWELREDGSWERRAVVGEPRSVQRELIDRHQARASDPAH